MPPKNFSSVTLPNRLVLRIKRVVEEDSRYDSVAEYVTKTLEKNIKRILKENKEGVS